MLYHYVSSLQRVRMFPTETNFFELLAYSKDLTQKKNIIRFITKSQYNVVKNIAKKILNGDVHLKNIQFRILKNKKLFLRKLSDGKIKIKYLPRECSTVCYIIKLGLEHYETRTKISTCACRKMGKNRRQNSRERSVSEISSSNEYSSYEDEASEFSDKESENSARVGEDSNPETVSDVSFSCSGAKEESI